MKKILMRSITCLLIALVLISQVAVYAENAGTYYIDEMKLELTIPEGYSVITRDTPSSDPIFNKLGTSKSTIINQFEETSVYLDAISNTHNEEIVVTHAKNDLSNFGLFSDEELNTLTSTLINGFKDYDMEVYKHDVYRHSQAKFIRLYWNNATNSVHGLQYYTIYNGYAMNFTLRSYEGDISTRQEEILKSIVDSVKYDESAHVEESVTTEGVVSEDDTTSNDDIKFENISFDDVEDDNKFELNVPILILSIIITIVAYCAFPIAFAVFKNKTITKKKYRRLCFLVNVAVMAGFIVVTNEPSNGVPYLLWTTVFSSVGIKILGRRGIAEENCDKQ